MWKDWSNCFCIPTYVNYIAIYKTFWTSVFDLLKLLYLALALISINAINYFHCSIVTFAITFDWLSEKAQHRTVIISAVVSNVIEIISPYMCCTNRCNFTKSCCSSHGNLTDSRACIFIAWCTITVNYMYQAYVFYLNRADICKTEKSCLVSYHVSLVSYNVNAQAQ